MTGVETAVIVAYVAAAAAVAGAAVGAVSAIQQGQNAKKAAKFNAEMAERQEQIALQNARVARQQAAQDADLQGREARRRIGAARAAYGAAGIDVEGSPLDILEESAMQAEMDKQTILYKGELRALGLQTEADSYDAQAGLERAQGRNAATSGYLGAGSAILTGVSNAAGSYFSGTGRRATASSATTPSYGAAGPQYASTY